MQKVYLINYKKPNSSVFNVLLFAQEANKGGEFN